MGRAYDAATPDTRNRLDKWLWCARFYKTRSEAAAAIAGGKVKLNGERVKPAHGLQPGDRLSLSLQDDAVDLEVLCLLSRRGPAAEAMASYAQTPESLLRRAVHREQRRVDALLNPRPDTRPDKRDRRRLQKLRRDNG
jgi:ribosome-associated heat shock protein Hsp15